MSHLDRARRLWADLARVPVSFPEPGQVRVVVSAGSWLCPAGWAGVVAICGAVLATVPDEASAVPLRAALTGPTDPGRSARALTGRTGRTGRRPSPGALPGLADLLADLGRLPGALPVDDVLGPASLAYVDAGGFVAAQGSAAVERLQAGDAGVRALLDAADEAETGESGLREILSDAFVLREGQEVVAVAGYRPWLNTAAHVSVLTAAHRRGEGLAKAVASAAVADALERGLLPQWRARPEASRRVARALGFDEVGAQVSVRLRD
ncbi:GNAT family N-acetyltransferase [Nonomuraea sp. NPDC049714]|uniref:GNAT family N-acetyltransferase n=1 Tax=Nonomuraea sp. NPDC049714 TaxID=3364357 RepID=UPI0037994042